MSRYTVTVRHGLGVISFQVFARTRALAIATVCWMMASEMKGVATCVRSQLPLRIETLRNTDCPVRR